MFGRGISNLQIWYGPIIIDVIFWIFFYILNFICNFFANCCEEGIKFICNFGRLRLRDIVDINLANGFFFLLFREFHSMYPMSFLDLLHCL
jgi:ABC-type multidrug transport system permease subunit